MDIGKKHVSDELVLPYFLGDDSERAQHKACCWAYGNNAGTAYAAFLDVGRGFLFGPLPMDSFGNRLDRNALVNAIAAGEHFELPMLYVDSKAFQLCNVPPSLREMIRECLRDYEPKREINLLFRRADGSLGFFIGRFGQGGFMDTTPEELYSGIRHLRPKSN